MRCLLVLLLVQASAAFHGVQVEDVTCVVCNSSQFCTAGERFHCPPQSDSVEPRITIEHCVCRGGHLRRNDSCDLGLPPAWYQEGLRHECVPDRITIADGAASSAECVCVRGLERTASGGCERCGDSHYGPTPNLTACVPCPDRSRHPGVTASTSVYDCRCDEGATGPDGHACELCATGKFKSVRGNSSCELCGADTFSDERGTIDPACTACHANASAVAGTVRRADCECDPGFASHAGDVCAQCVPGTVKSRTANEACELCGAGHFQDEPGRTACDGCGAHSVAAPDHARCMCQPGHWERGVAFGLADCELCPDDTFQPAHDQSGCESCPANKRSDRGSAHVAECRCDEGWTEPEILGACVSCVAGKYKDFVSYDDHEDCVVCPDFSHSAATSTARSNCTCNAGFSGPDGGACTACAPGSFKAGPGDASCTPCPADTYQNLSAATVCEACVERSTSLAESGRDDIEDCLCDSGVGRLGARESPSCVTCVEGEFEDTTCEGCLDDSFTNTTGAVACQACPANAGTHMDEQEARTYCECDTGYTSDTTEDAPLCAACPEHTYKDEPGSGSCTACWRDSQALEASTAVADCMCNAGFHHGGPEPAYPCLGCALDYYQDDIGEAACKQCPPHALTLADTSTALTDCLCAAGFAGPLGGPCTACEPGSFKAGPGDANCALCPADTYQPGSNASACVPCHEHSFSAAGTVLLATCKCNDGFTPIAGPACSACEPGKFAHVESQVCTTCAGGTFSADFGVVACSVCGAHALSHEQPHVACQCDAGFVLDNASCVACGADYYKDRFGDEGCVRCQAHSQAPPASLEQEACECNAGYEQDGPAVCQMCEPGAFSDALDTESCPACAHPSFSGASGQTVCTFCLPDSSVNNASTGCNCHAGFTSTGRDGDGAEHCAPCAANLYKEAQNNAQCLPCQDNSKAVEGASSFEQCLCDRGYERVGRECVPCPAGSFKDHTNNSYGCVPCTRGYTFTGSAATEQCTPCEVECIDGAGEPRQFASTPCNETHDRRCSACQICAPGSYAFPECSDGANHDRNDTVCAACLADSVCHGGLHIEACPAHSHSPEGSTGVEACVCVPGRFMTGAYQCEPCPDDFFCADNARTRCPAHSQTAGGFQSVVLDCVCDGGFFKNASTPSFFTCAQCTVDDYCFNNSLFNCSDVRMQSPVGSAAASDCVCMPGYYNNGTRCEHCATDTFCEDGVMTACAADRWTSDEALLDAPDKCLCRPGLYQRAGECATCLQDHFCEGDNIAQLCPLNSSTDGLLGLLRCNCDIGFESVLAGNVLSCELCAEGHYKHESGNAACTPCVLCEGQLTFEISACVPDSNRICQACTTCLQPNFRRHTCNVLEDTVCEACTVCDFAQQIETHECNEDSLDAQCTAIDFGHACLAGSVAGNHTRYLQPHCLACEVRPSTDPADRWFDFTSPGSGYADVHSCDVRCRGFSRLRDATNHSRGCRSCETGNVLFREMGSECSFTCREGYALDAAGSDCELPVLRQGPGNTLPFLRISNWMYENDGHNITVAHGDTNRFVVLVGRHAPLHCAPGVCCYGDLARVSTKQQMGLAPGSAEACSREYGISAGYLSAKALWTHIPHAELERIAACTPSASGMLCELVVSLLDVLFWRTISHTLLLHVNTSSTLVVLNAETQYLPLEEVVADVILVSRTASAELWQVALHMPAVEGPPWAVDVAVRGMGFSPGPTLCGSYGARAVLLAAPRFNASRASVVWVSQWASLPGAGTVHVVLTLQREQALMNIAVVRNTTHAVAQCNVRPQRAELATGEVFAASGLGRAAVDRRQQLAAHAPWRTTGYGNADRLFSFVALGTTGAPVAISLKRLLAAHTTANLTALPAPQTRFHGGRLAFDYGFREWCRAQRGCEYEYVAIYARLAGRANMLRVDCAQRDAARRWLQVAIGAHRDAGHVDALCAVVEGLSSRHAVAFLVAAGHVLNRQEWAVQAYSTLLWPQFGFETLVA